MSDIKGSLQSTAIRAEKLRERRCRDKSYMEAFKDKIRLNIHHCNYNDLVTCLVEDLGKSAAGNRMEERMRLLLGYQKTPPEMEGDMIPPNGGFIIEKKTTFSMYTSRMNHIKVNTKSIHAVTFNIIDDEFNNTPMCFLLSPKQTEYERSKRGYPAFKGSTEDWAITLSEATIKEWIKNGYRCEELERILTLTYTHDDIIAFEERCLKLSSN